MANKVGMPPRHGHSVGYKTSPTYNSWSGMRNRCCNENAEQYSYYGGRGITRHERWEKFDNFLADMGARPENTTLDRIDPNGNYVPENCRWASALQQNNNRTNTICLSAFGKEKTLTEWARSIGMSINMLRKRINRGWSIERALTEGSKMSWGAFK